MATIDVKDATGTTQTIQEPLAPGRAADSASRPVALSNEDVAVLGALTEAAPASDTASSGLNGRLQRLAQRITSLIALLPTALGPQAYSASLAVVLPNSATGTQSSVAGSASAVTLLAANVARLGAAFFNDSTAICYLILSSTTPTTSAYTVQLGPNDYYEVPARYTGIVKGIWASATGNMRVTELT